MKYGESVKYLESFWKFGIKLGLARMYCLLDKLGNPHKGLKIVHVAGTNGKGSVCAMLASILAESGLKVGLYTSPHLLDYTERFRILGTRDRGIGASPQSLATSPRSLAASPRSLATSPLALFKDAITKVEFSKYVSSIKKIINAYPRDIEKPTEFEILTAIAFKYFFDEEVDIAVVETGLGGRLDSTNVITPLVSVITDISLDHTQLLGKTIKNIALEKAGIIKPSVPVVASGGSADAVKVISSVCEKAKSPLTFVKRPLEGFKLSLRGAHQKRNAALVVQTIKLLKEQGFRISVSQVRKGLANTVWPGRFQVVRENPLVIIDGAHNAAGVRALLREIGDNYSGKNKVFVLGILKDKDYNNMIKDICAEADLVIASAPGNSRALSPREILRQCRRHKVDALLSESVPGAVKLAEKLSGSDGLICVTGSLFTAGEALSSLRT